MNKIYFIIILWIVWIIVLSYIRSFFHTWARDFLIPLLISLGTIIYLILSIYIIVIEKSLGANLIAMTTVLILHEFRHKAYDWHKSLIALPLLFFILLTPIYFALGVYIMSCPTVESAGRDTNLTQPLCNKST